MYIGENNDWMRYSSKGDWHLSSIKDCGKWMFYFNTREFAIDIINKGLNEKIITYAKHTKGAGGICCLYVSGTNLNDHLKVIDFMVANNLIRLTSNLKYFDTTFKFNAMSWAKEYGNYFQGIIKLSDFIDLSTGNKLPNITVLDNIAYKTSPVKQSELISSLYNQTIIYIDRKINEVLSNNPQIDINDKLMYLIPIIDSFETVFNNQQSNNLLLSNICQVLDNYLIQNPNSKTITQLRNKNINSVDTLLDIGNGNLYFDNLYKVMLLD